MKTQLISREIIKPSIPTPQSRTTLSLSYIDHFHGGSYFHTLFFYSANNSEAILNKTNVLKRSLSLVLSRYYPIAGRINEDRVSINCDDSGVEFHEARINCQLEDVLGQPEVSTMSIFFPISTEKTRSVTSNVLPFIQVTIFECGGMALGTSFSHKLIDACSLSSFMNDWASIAQGHADPYKDICPLFIGSSNILPIKEIVNLNSQKIHRTDLVPRRIVFNASNIHALKAKVVDEGSNSSKFEVVVSLLHKCIMGVSSSLGLPKPGLISTMVNMRRRARPPLPDNSIGIFALQCFIEIKLNEEPTDLHGFVGQLKNGIARFCRRFETETIVEEWSSEICKTFKEREKVLKGEDLNRLVSTTSWCKFPFYEVDFGWGKPIWVAPPKSLAPGNCIVLWDNSGGDGIEAWVTLREQVMAEFERDSELLSYGSFNTSPL